MRNYRRLEIEEFGAHLLSSGDLDPVYTTLVRLWEEGTLSARELYQWLVGYWSFYSCGTACYLSEMALAVDFWKVYHESVVNETAPPIGGRWPRGHERRHFRGKAALKSEADLYSKYNDDPTRMVAWVMSFPDEERTMTNISKRVQTHVGFGPWIGFKVADMVDRVLGVPVSFSNAEVFMFKDPEKAAWMLWNQRMADKYPPNSVFKREKVLGSVSEYLINHFSTVLAPPFEDRPVNIQEVETILCKWKSHRNGHYPLNNDIEDITKGTEPWAKVSPKAERFLEVLNG